MELKGNNLKNIKGSIINKMKKTLKKMKKTREKPINILKSKLEEKLNWATEEKAKGERAIKRLKIQVQRLEGAIIAISEILEEENKK